MTREFEGEPQYFLYHKTGPHLRAIFKTATEARYWEVASMQLNRYHDMFYVEDVDGDRVTFDENQHGHAFAIMKRL